MIESSTPVPLNTDDRMLLEFAFARNRQGDTNLSFNEMRQDAAAAGANRPATRGNVNWDEVDEERVCMSVAYGGPSRPQEASTDEQAQLLRAFNYYVTGDFAGAWDHWKLLGREPHTLRELLLVAESSADRGDDSAAAYIDQVQKILPNLAEAFRARLFARLARVDEAGRALHTFIRSLHVDPWSSSDLVSRTLNIATDMLNRDSTGTDSQAHCSRAETTFRSVQQ